MEVAIIKKTLFVIIFICLLFTGFLQIQAKNHDSLSFSLDEIIQKSIVSNRIPGVAVSAAQNGEIVYSRGFTGSWSRSGEKISTDTLFYIGSISKSFTALGIMQLVEAGLIDLDNSVQEYITDFQVDDNGFDGMITIRHLLHHRSGLTEKEYFNDLPADLSIEAGVKDLYGMRLSYNPGDGFSYFNPNYNILGLVIEKVSGQSYENYLTENILQPLEMFNTYLNKDDAAGVVSGHGAVFSIPIKRDEKFKVYNLPSGYIVSNINDMSNYLLYQLSGEFKGRQLLSEDFFEILHLPYEGEQGYGMGWNKGTKFDQKLVEHGGSLFNYSANMALLPDSETGVVVLINQNHFIYNIISNNQLVDNILKFMIDPGILADELSVIPLGNIFLVIIIIAFITIIKEIYELINLNKWAQKFEVKSRFRIYLDIILDFLIPGVLLMGIPLIIMNLLDRVLSFGIALNLMPGVFSWLIIISLCSLVRGVLKVIISIKSN